MFSLSLPKNSFEYQQQQIQPLTMLFNQIDNKPRQNLFQNYMKIRFAKMEIKNLAKTQNQTLRGKTSINRSLYPIQNGQCKLENKDASQSARVVIKKFQNVKRKQSENWSDLKQWNFTQDETIQM